MHGRLLGTNANMCQEKGGSGQAQLEKLFLVDCWKPTSAQRWRSVLRMNYSSQSCHLILLDGQRGIGDAEAQQRMRDWLVMPARLAVHVVVYILNVVDR
ncbi:hypothetical protein [Burkholderia cepacia]|uniref:hypothetical protein n=1 Tax=Burkholderia cepacia TaxID=292 RepID=UPI0012D4760C|nr:hypothetical protein [Burkholderia cepacia]